MGVETVVEVSLAQLSLSRSHYLSGSVGGWVGGGLNENNAILNSVDVVVEVGVELGKMDKWVHTHTE